MSADIKVKIKEMMMRPPQQYTLEDLKPDLGLNYWEITDPKDKMRDIVYGTYEQVVDFALEQDYFCKIVNENVIHRGSIRITSIRIIDLV